MASLLVISAVPEPDASRCYPPASSYWVSACAASAHPAAATMLRRSSLRAQAEAHWVARDSRVPAGIRMNTAGSAGGIDHIALPCARR